MLHSDALHSCLLHAHECRSTPTSRSLFSESPLSGWLIVSLFPIFVEGVELIWVKDPDRLCLGRIGGGGNGCLKEKCDCGVEAHVIHKCKLFSSKPFLMLKGSEHGYEPVVLQTNDLEEDYVKDLLNQSKVNWVEEFAQICMSNAKNQDNLEASKALLCAAQKHTLFATPAKRNVVDKLTYSISDLCDLNPIISEMALLQFNSEGERGGSIPEFTQEGFIAAVGDFVRGLIISQINCPLCISYLVINLRSIKV